MATLDAATRYKQTGRNDDCACGSGKKYKKCHLREDEESISKALAEKNAEAAKIVDEPGHEGHGHAPGMHGVEAGAKPKFEAVKSAAAGPKQMKVAKAVNTPRKAV